MWPDSQQKLYSEWRFFISIENSIYHDFMKYTCLLTTALWKGGNCCLFYWLLHFDKKFKTNRKRFICTLFMAYDSELSSFFTKNTLSIVCMQSKSRICTSSCIFCYFFTSVISVHFLMFTLLGVKMISFSRKTALKKPSTILLLMNFNLSKRKKNT